MARTHAVDVVLVILLWAGGLFGTERAVARLLDTGTDTGFTAEEVVRGHLPVQRLILSNSGQRRARVRIMVPRSMPVSTGYLARIDSDTTTLQVVPEGIAPEGMWFEVRNALKTTDGVFRWPAQRAVIVTPPTGTSIKFEILDWQVILDDAAPDSRTLARKRERIDAILIGLFIMGSLAGVVTTLRKKQGQDQSPSDQAPAPAVVPAEVRLISPDEVNPSLFLDLLVTSVRGEPTDEHAMQRFLRLRLGGYDYDSALDNLALDPSSPRYRAVPYRAAVIFTRKVDACLEEFKRARQRFP